MDIITIEELHNRLNTGEQINLIDVREPYEHEEFNIGGVLHPLGRIMSADVDDIEQLKDSEVIVYCRSGNRSGQAAMMLESMGFSKVKNLQGGMMAWRVQFPG
jgi:rhodanese-related sulfurtransferase